MNRLFALCLLCFLTLPINAHSETITIVADRWCPYNCEPGSEQPGLMIEIAQKAFAKHNIMVEYSAMPWSRAIEETRQNKHVAIVGAAHKDAPDFIFPKVPQGHMTNSFYVKKGDTWKFTGMDSLANISLGVVADYSYNDELDAHIAKNKNTPKFIQMISGDNALETNVKKLLAGRVSAITEGEYVMQYHLAKNNLLGQLEVAGSLPESANDNLYIAFSPKNPKSKTYAEILTRETDALRKSGELQKILDSYNVSDWKK